MERDIEYMVNYCQQFVEKQNMPLKITQPQDFRSQGEGTYWLRGAGDGRQNLIVMEVVPTRTTNSAWWTANKVRKWFSKFGYPYTLIWDIGDKFVSQELKIFLENCGNINHISLSSQIRWDSREVCSNCQEESELHVRRWRIQYKLQYIQLSLNYVYHGILLELLIICWSVE